jgi:mRNA-degrading endonuclease toxin of MazEF toxin-antitoxin module
MAKRKAGIDISTEVISKELIHRGDVLYIDIGDKTQGTHCQRGIRPCIVLTSDKLIQQLDVLTVIPCTTNYAKFPITFETHVMFNIGKIVNVALIDHIMTIDCNRICGQSVLYHMNSYLMSLIEISIKQTFGLS